MAVPAPNFHFVKPFVKNFSDFFVILHKILFPKPRILSFSCHFFHFYTIFLCKLLNFCTFSLQRVKAQRFTALKRASAPWTSVHSTLTHCALNRPSRICAYALVIWLFALEPGRPTAAHPISTSPLVVWTQKSPILTVWGFPVTHCLCIFWKGGHMGAHGRWINAPI